MSGNRLNPLTTNLPSRLSRETVELASRYLLGEYQARLRPACFSDATIDLPKDASFETRHGKLALLIAEKSPLDILPEERLAGSASNLEALSHCVPGRSVKGGWDSPASSISHTTVDFGDAVRKGLSGLETEVKGKLAVDNDMHHKEFYLGLLDVVEAMRTWNRRYIAAYKELLANPDAKKHENNIRVIISTLSSVPENPPKTFREAIQSFWSFFEFQRLCGNWSGLGRFDEILGPYLTNDLENGVITLDEARELIAHFWIKGTEWCFGLRQNTNLTPGSGDAQFYQNVVLSGIDGNGKQIENDVTFLVLDVVEELHISDYPIAVRVNEKTSEKLLRRIADVQLLGGGIVSIYNEPLVLKGLASLGIPEEEARTFTNDGCWEVIIPGKTNFKYSPTDVLLQFQNALFCEKPPVTFDEVYSSFLDNMRVLASEIRQAYAKSDLLPGKASPGDYTDAVNRSDVVLSLLEPSCRESGCSYLRQGTKYVFFAVHLAGLQDVANSLLAIKELVFKQHLLTLPELVEILKNDWQGAEELRLKAANSILYYGNDNDAADEMTRRVYDDCTGIISEIRQVGYIKVPVGISTFGREIQWSRHRLATAFGKHAHEYLAPNMSPTPGTDKSPLSSVINSYCKLNLVQTPNGCPLDLRLSAGIRKLPNAPELLANILQAFIRQGGFYLQLDTADADMLRAAQQEPDRFPNLVVRISGWSARFASLDKNWQDMIINRTALEAL